MDCYNCIRNDCPHRLTTGECIGYKAKTMTNREWLNGLTNEELAIEIYDLLDYFRNNIKWMSKDFNYKESFILTIENWLEDRKGLFRH